MPSESTLSARPWLSASLYANTAFWDEYVRARPSPDESLFELIATYHAQHSTRTRLVHDVATGPGNIAQRLAKYFDRVVASDINETALAAGRAMLPPDLRSRVSFVHAAADTIDSIVPPASANAIADADAVVAGECMPLLDNEASERAFHSALAPGGTLAIYFYGRPIFVDGAGRDAGALNAAYAAVATRCTQLYNPHVTGSSSAFHAKTATTLASYLDDVALPRARWAHVVRRRVNCDRPLLFADPEAYLVPPVAVDRKAAEETVVESTERAYWRHEWTVEHVRAWIRSTFPRIEDYAGEEWKGIAAALDALGVLMGGERAVCAVTWPVVIVLATKR